MRAKTIVSGLALMALVLWPQGLVRAAPIRNVILCIGDGMGAEQIKAARLYAGYDLSFESFPFQSIMTTESADSLISDSAASASAMATGIKVNNGVISLQLPGDGLLDTNRYYRLITVEGDGSAPGSTGQ